MNTGVKLSLVAVVVVSVTAYMAFLGGSTTWQYYLTVDECLDGAPALENHRLRVHGRIFPGTLQIAADRGQAQFELAGQTGRLAVCCVGPLPDNLKDDCEVVVEGRLRDPQTLSGDRVLTQCASKYQSMANTEKPERTAASESEGAR